MTPREPGLTAEERYRVAAARTAIAQERVRAALRELADAAAVDPALAMRQLERARRGIEAALDAVRGAL